MSIVHKGIGIKNKHTWLCDATLLLLKHFVWVSTYVFSGNISNVYHKNCIMFHRRNSHHKSRNTEINGFRNSYTTQVLTHKQWQIITIWDICRKYWNSILLIILEAEQQRKIILMTFTNTLITCPLTVMISIITEIT